MEEWVIDSSPGTVPMLLLHFLHLLHHLLLLPPPSLPQTSCPPPRFYGVRALFPDDYIDRVGGWVGAREDVAQSASYIYLRGRREEGRGKRRRREEEGRGSARGVLRAEMISAPIQTFMRLYSPVKLYTGYVSSISQIVAA